MIIIRKYQKSKKLNAPGPVDLNQHIYDTPDSYDLRPSLPPRLSKMERLYESRDDPSKGTRNGSGMCGEDSELKESSCDHTQLTHNNFSKLLLSDNQEPNGLPTIPVQLNNAYGTTTVIDNNLDHAEILEELCDPPTVNLSETPILFNILSSGQTSDYEQIQGYEKVRQYEQIQLHEEIQHCDVNLTHLVGKVKAETVIDTASATALSSEDTQPQCHPPASDFCDESEGRKLETPLEVKNVTESNSVRVPIVLNSASIQFESCAPIVNKSLQESTGFSTGNSLKQTAGGYKQICGYEKIEHCDINLAHMFSPTIAAEDQQ